MKKYKPLVLPISMIAGVLFYEWMDSLVFLSPYLIFIMLVITYCRVEPREFRIGKFQFHLLLVQLAMSGIAYGIFSIFSHTLAEGVFICVFIPTATAAPVITGMLGGSITKLVSYSLTSNLACAVLGPVILAAIGDHPDMGFQESFNLICSRVLPLLILPMITALVLRYTWRKFHDTLANHQSISFYIWAVSLFIVVGSSVSFLIKNYKPGDMWMIVALCAGALLVCLLQFKAGRLVGGKYGDKVSGGQGLGQKNTVLAIWLALAYLNPIASVAPAAYVAWQNLLNSWQIVNYNRKKEIKKAG